MTAAARTVDPSSLIRAPRSRVPHQGRGLALLVSTVLDTALRSSPLSTLRTLGLAAMVATCAASATSARAEDAAPARSEATAPSGAVVDRIAAVVNDQVITLSEIYDLGSREIRESCGASTDPDCRAKLEGEVLDVLVRQALMKQDLIKLQMDVTAEEVDTMIQQTLVEHGYANREELRAVVEAEGFTWDSYRAFLADRERVQRFQGYVLRQRVTITDDEVLDLYNRLTREMDAPEVVRIAAFGYKLPPSATTDQRVAVVTEFSTKLAEVRAGTRSWAELAEVSDTARVARLFEGQTFEEGQLIPAMAEVVFKAEVGVACEPVLVGDVLYGMILLGKEKGAAEAPPFEEVKNNLMDQVFMQKIEAAENQWYAAARRKAAITRMVGIEPDPI